MRRRVVCPRSHPASPHTRRLSGGFALARGAFPGDDPRTPAWHARRGWCSALARFCGGSWLAGWPWLGGLLYGPVSSLPVVHLICLTRVDSGSEDHQCRLPRSSAGAAGRSRGAGRRDVRPGASGVPAVFQGGSPGETSGCRQVRNPASKSQIVRTCISLQGRPARGGVARAAGNP